MDKGTILRTAANNYKIGNCLGRGAQGSVYEGFRSDGLKFAIKLIRVITADSLRRQRTEGWVYQQFPNHLVTLVDWNLECSRPFLVWNSAFMARHVLNLTIFQRGTVSQ